MSKASLQRKAKQAAVLRGMFDRNPEEFCRAWSKRITSAIFLIRERAREMSTKSPAVFAVLDDCLMLLKDVGGPAFRQHGPETHKVLTREACRVLDLQFLPDAVRFSRWSR